MKLHHVGIEVEDLYAIERFYRCVLGFTPLYHYVSRNSPGLRTVFLERDGIRIELLERPRPPAWLRRAETPNHLALEVDDVDAEHARLAALAFPGVALSPPRNTGDGFRELTLRDPEGNIVEIAARIGPEPRYALQGVVFALDALVGGANARPDGPAEGRAQREVMRFWSLLRARGVLVAIASGRNPNATARALSPLGIAGELGAVVCSTEVARERPAPDLFLEAARRLGVAPETCAVVERSPEGVQAARRALMRSIALVDDRGEPPHADFALADRRFTTEAPFDADLALAWVEAEGAGRDSSL